MIELPVIPRPAEPVRPPRVRELPLNRLVDEWVPDGADLSTPTAGIARYARQLILGDGTVFDPEFSVRLRYGSGAPNNSLGSIGDAYVNSSTGWFYEKTGETVWTVRGVLALSISNFEATFYCPDGQSRSVSFIDGSLPAHAGTHVGLGADKIRDATSSQDGLMTAAYAQKLDTIESGADVTDAAKVATVIHGASSKTTPVDADTVPLIDSAASNVLKKVTWANFKAALKTHFDAIYAAAASVLGGSTGSVDNVILRADGTGGKTAQASVVTVTDAGNLSTPGSVEAGVNASGFGDSVICTTIVDPANPATGAISIANSQAGRRLYFGTPTNLVYALNFSNVQSVESHPVFKTTDDMQWGGNQGNAIFRSGNDVIYNSTNGDGHLFYVFPTYALIGTSQLGMQLDTGGNVSVHLGDVEVVNNSKGLILKSPNGTRWRLSVSDAGVISSTSL